jgi:cellobiose phosphorylase
VAADVNANGTLRRIVHGDVVVNLFPASEIEGGPANLFLRRLDDTPQWTPLLGPRSPLEIGGDEGGIRAAGMWQGVHVTVSFTLAASAPAWFWHVQLENRSDTAIALDLIHTQDVGLAPWGAIRMNEYYVSQYLDHMPLGHPAHGWMVATRQNQPVDGRHPWLILGALGNATSFATDALDVHGRATRAGGAPTGLVAAELPGRRRQHEHAMVALQQAPLQLAPGAISNVGFFGWFESDHPEATAIGDLDFADRALVLPEAGVPAAAPAAASAPAAPTLFTTAALLACRDLASDEIEREWPGARRHVERDGDATWSFFTGESTHVVLRAKEHQVLRPHGHLLRTGGHLVPDEASLTTTAWMAGVFNSLLTQGHVSINRVLSTNRSYLGLFRAHGQRVFVEHDGRWQLLDVPSAWEATPGGCRWLYAHDGGLIEVKVTAPTTHHAIELSITVRAGAPARFLVSHHVAWNGDDGDDAVPACIERDGTAFLLRPLAETDAGHRFPEGWFRIAPGAGTAIADAGGDEMLFIDGGSRSLPWFVIATEPSSAISLEITGNLVAGAATAGGDGFWRTMAGATGFTAPQGNRLEDDVARLGEILPWYAHNALVHYLAPRGLEQFSGGGWGTRDVCQGPVEMLLALGRHEPVRDLLLRVFSQQNPDGDWPQWFMFFERERNIRPDDSHGDIVYWPVRALALYLAASEDASILDDVVPFFDAAGPQAGEPATIAAHVERAFEVMRRRVIPGTHLAAYGHGDWNDSLQPADPAMRERLVSAWTVTLHHETLTTLAGALARLGHPASAGLRDEAAQVRAEFDHWLFADGVLAGFAYFREDGQVDHLLHPRDGVTGIHYRLLPMIHAILADLLSPDVARAHVALMREHLLGSDGARLFDRPPPYRGGPMRQFQRAESSTYFGREIGLMYTHAHLRYAEAMAHLGDADAFFEALRRAHPIGIRDVVAAARPRQANCYYSSSDADVADRHEAAGLYADVRAGRVPLEGGWRVYSSGAGIAFRLIHECFLGLRRGASLLGIDPVIPPALDGLEADVDLDGRPLRVRYRIATRGVGPLRVAANGRDLPLTAGSNPYRPPGVTVAMAELRALLGRTDDELLVELG